VVRMTDKNTRKNPLKEKFFKIERKLSPESQTEEQQVHASTVEPAPTITEKKYLKSLVQKLKNYKKLLNTTEDQLVKNAVELKGLLEVKENQKYQIERILESLEETQSVHNKIIDALNDLEKDRSRDEARIGRLHSKKIELEGSISEKTREKEALAR